MPLLITCTLTNLLSDRARSRVQGLVQTRLQFFLHERGGIDGKFRGSRTSGQNSNVRDNIPGARPGRQYRKPLPPLNEAQRLAGSRCPERPDERTNEGGIRVRNRWYQLARTQLAQHSLSVVEIETTSLLMPGHAVRIEQSITIDVAQLLPRRIPDNVALDHRFAARDQLSTSKIEGVDNAQFDTKEPCVALVRLRIRPRKIQLRSKAISSQSA